MQADKVFEALASSQRRQILAYLSKTEMTTSDLAARFEMTTPSMSRHLSVLENAGLVTSKLELSSDGKALNYFEVTSFNIALTPAAIVKAVKTLN